MGYVILGIGATALVSTNTKQTQANQPEPVTETTTPYNRSRHVITLTLNQLDELKVTERKRINGLCPEKGRKYLIDTYTKKSRVHLSDGELIAF